MGITRSIQIQRAYHVVSTVFSNPYRDKEVLTDHYYKSKRKHLYLVVVNKLHPCVRLSSIMGSIRGYSL